MEWRDRGVHVRCLAERCERHEVFPEHYNEPEGSAEHLMRATVAKWRREDDTKEASAAEVMRIIEAQFAHAATHRKLVRARAHKFRRRRVGR
jgi:hypothetical protein